MCPCQQDSWYRRKLVRYILTELGLQLFAVEDVAISGAFSEFFVEMSLVRTGRFNELWEGDPCSKLASNAPAGE